MGARLIFAALGNKVGDLGARLVCTTEAEWLQGLGESVTIGTRLVFITCKI